MLRQGPVGTPEPAPHALLPTLWREAPAGPWRGRAVATQQGHLASLRHSEGERG